MSDDDDDHLQAIHHELHSHLPAEPALRVKALESLLVEKGMLDPKAVDAWIEVYTEEIGPKRGATLVAKAWLDRDFKQRLLADGTAAISELGFDGWAGGHFKVVENTPQIHNLVVCTLCSCYPHTVLGVPPNWYKTAAYRARAVREPRQVLAEFGAMVGEDIEIQVWDSTSELRYMVLPERPPGTDGMNEEQLAAQVTRNSIIGTERRLGAGRGRQKLMDGIHDLGGRQGYGPVDTKEKDEPFHAPWEARLLGIVRAMSRLPSWSIDRFRHTRELIAPADYLTRPYYDQWLQTYAAMMIESGVATLAELASGKAAGKAEGLPPPMTAATVDKAKKTMNRFDRPSDATAKFAIGDKVTANRDGFSGHTRLPQYARGRTGRIERFHGAHILPDTNMRGTGPAEPLYTVSFAAAELWPEARGRRDEVFLDLWESYLEAA